MSSSPGEPTVLDRYTIHGVIASGGMASVHLGRFAGPGGFARVVAIKRMHRHLASEREFSAMFVDEARLAARIRHPNVVSTLDVLAREGELLIVMEYVHGESLARLSRTVADRRGRVPVSIACAIVADLLAGLHAAHEACDERGQPLHIVHRDVSPPNVLVGLDGVARVLDFGVAKAVGRVQQTRDGEVKGKLRYMAPEQVRGAGLSRAVDVYAASVVLWETLTGKRLFGAEQDADVVEQILFGTIDAPSARAPDVPEALNSVVLRGLARDPSARYATARDMGRALRDCVRLASASTVGDWVEETARADLDDRAAAVAAIDAGTDVGRISRVSRLSLPRVRSRDSAAVVLPPEAIGTEVAILGESRPVRARSRGRRPMALALIGLALIPIAAVAVRAGLRRGEIHATSAVPPPPSLSSAPIAPASSAPLEPAAVSVSAEASAQPPAIRPRSNPTAHPRPHSDCNPPYTTDPDGTRHYKLQCL